MNGTELMGVNDTYSRKMSSSESSESDTSFRTDTTWRYSVFGSERLGRGAMLFTGMVIGKCYFVVGLN